MLFSCYNITKCTLTTDRQIATTRARMVHGQTVHIWWNEWKASCLLLPPHFPYRNPFRRSFSFVLFSQEKEPSLDPSALNKCDIWCLYENDGRHHIDAVGWGRPLVRRQRPCIDSFIVVFLRIAVCFCFFLRVERRARGTCSVGHRRLREAKAVGSVIDRLHRLCEHRQHVLADVYANGANTNSIPRKTTLWANYGRLITFRSCCR